MSAPEKKRILIADGGDASRTRTAGILAGGGYEVVQARSGKDAVLSIREQHPDVILMDVAAANDAPHRIVQTLRADPHSQHIPILFVSDGQDVEQTVRCLTEGANDYITRPYHTAELLARVGVAIRIKALQDALREKNEQLAALVLVDELTGLYTRLHMEQRLEEEVVRAQRYGLPIACLMLDLDRFKHVNDTHGHPAGDAVLRQLGSILRDSVRAADFVARYGGEEFIIVCPQTSRDGSRAAAERIRRSVERARFLAGEVALGCTVSVGVASASAGLVPDRAELLRRADAALYRAKENGRNRVEMDEG